jgi:hypothetical protein
MEVDSYDCNIPGQAGCTHKELYTAPTSNDIIFDVIASDEYVYWMQFFDSPAFEFRLMRVHRSGGNAGALVTPAEPNTDPFNYDGFFLDDTHIYFKHDGLSKVDQDGSIAFWNFFLDEIEVTQGIQNLDNDIALVAEKPTFVNVYARQFAGPDAGVVQARIVGTRIGVPLPGSPIFVHGAPATEDAGVAAKRHNLARWTFELPHSWTSEGSTLLQVTIDPYGIFDLTPSVSSRTVTFNGKAPICLVGIPVRVHGPTAKTTQPEYSFAVSTATRMLPVPAIWRYRQSMRLEEGIPGFYSPYEMDEDS